MADDTSDPPPRGPGTPGACALRTLDALRPGLDDGTPLMMSSLLLTRQHLLIQRAQVQGRLDRVAPLENRLDLGR